MNIRHLIGACAVCALLTAAPAQAFASTSDLTEGRPGPRASVPVNPGEDDPGWMGPYGDMWTCLANEAFFGYPDYPVTRSCAELYPGQWFFKLG